LIDYYKKQKKLHIVSGMAPVTEVFQNIESIIDKVKNELMEDIEVKNMVTEE
jgi:hypothetical protein